MKDSVRWCGECSRVQAVRNGPETLRTQRSGGAAPLSRRAENGEQSMLENREDAFTGLVDDLRAVAKRLRASSEMGTREAGSVARVQDQTELRRDARASRSGHGIGGRRRALRDPGAPCSLPALGPPARARCSTRVLGSA